MVPQRESSKKNLAAISKELLVERGNQIGVSDIRRQMSEILNVTVQQEDYGYIESDGCGWVGAVQREGADCLCLFWSCWLGNVLIEEL